MRYSFFNYRSKIFLIIILLPGVFCFAQHPTEKNLATESVISGLSPPDSNHFERSNVDPRLNQEDVFFVTDKPYYIAGDEMWYSARLLDAFSRQPEPGKRIIYADLVAPDDSVVLHQVLEADSGVASGKMTLPETLAGGCYLLHGYTDWMRNFSTAGYLGHTVMIKSGNNQFSNEMDNSGIPDTVLIDFYPEGGNLVNTLNSKVAIKATDKKGEGLMVTGELTDDRGRNIIKIQTNAMGIGEVSFTPKAGREYYARIDHVNLRTVSKQYSLPESKESGYTIEVAEKGKNLLSVRVEASKDLRNKGVMLVAQAGGRVFYRENFKLGGTEKTLWMLRSGFPEGSVQLCLFDADGNLIGQRLLFIDHPGHEPRVTIKAGKSEYNPDEPVTLQVHLGDNENRPAQARLSVSVTANDIFQATQFQDPWPEILLQSDFFESIQNPGYYFRDTTAATRKDLDNLMLTLNRYRYDWRLLTDTLNLQYNRMNTVLIGGKVIMNKKPCRIVQ